jgi:hypothetical protein
MINHDNTPYIRTKCILLDMDSMAPASLCIFHSLTHNYPETIHVDFGSSGLRHHFGNNLLVEPAGIIQMAQRAFSMSLCTSCEATQPAER